MKLADLKLNVNEIPSAGTVLQGALPVEWVRDSLLPPYTAESPVDVRLEVRLMGTNVFVEGEIAVTLSYECSRTLAPAEDRLEIRIAELFIPDDGRDINLGDGLSSDDLDDDEPCLIKGGIVDLEDLLREQLVLSQDPWPVAPGQERAVAGDDSPVWTSNDGDVDPRWAKLKNLKPE